MKSDDKLRRELKSIFDYNQEVVDFTTFCESSDYIGVSGVYDYWKENFNKADEATSRCILTGSTGAGKSTALNLLTLYKLYLLIMAGGPDIGHTLGLIKGSPVFFLYFSVSLTMAKISGFAQLSNFIDGSKWFRENFPRDTSTDSVLKFPNNFSIRYASGDAHAIGLNVWGFILDEANFRDNTNKSGSSAEFERTFKLAQQLENRLAQRFLRKGVEHFFASYISSASYDTAFIQDISDQYRGTEHAIVLDPVLYKVDPLRYTKERFEVFLGYGELTPVVVKDEAHRQSIISLLKQNALDDDKIETCFEKVPLELKYRFENKNNIYLAIQEICGKPTAVRGSFVTNYEVIKSSYTSTAPSPFIQDSVIASNKDNNQIQDICDITLFEKPNYPHSLFLDLSLQYDEGSLSCVRYDGEFGGVKYHTHVFTLEIIPPDFPAMTDVTKVQNFIIWLGQHINIAAFASDNFQSVQLRQEVVKALDLSDIRVSLDSTDAPHLLWLNACASHRYRMKYYERLDTEIREAVHDLKRRRVVKRSGSSDDQFQSNVGALFLSDTVASSGVYVGERLNVVGVSAAERLIQTANASSNTMQGAADFLRRESLKSASSVRSYKSILDKING